MAATANMELRSNIGLSGLWDWRWGRQLRRWSEMGSSLVAISH
jgi:hypothetical protein